MELRREMGLVHVFCIATGAMISSGLFILPGLAHALAGPAVVVSYFLAGLLALTGMLSQAELVSAMPKAGGTYFYVTRSMGPAVGTVDGIITWLSLALKSAFALVGMAAFTKMFTSLDIHIIAILLCIVFVIINLIGAKDAATLQQILVFGLLGVLFYYIVRGIPEVKALNFEPFAPNGFKAILATAGFVFVSFGGLLKVAAIAVEVKDPVRTVPRAMILSLVVVSIIYTLVIFVTSGVLGAEQLDHSLTPISDGAEVFLGRTGVLLLGLAAILAFVSTANAGIMSASRYPLALARDNLVPEVLGRTNKRFKTPHVALLTTGCFIVLVLFMPLTALVKVASSVLIVTFLFSCLSVIVMRESRVQNYQPRFRSPLYPWIQLIGIAGCIALLIGMGAAALLSSLALIAGGLFIYWFYGRIRTTREYALLHLIERITSRELVSGSLETELKQIIRERDEIVLDRFDHLVQTCPVLDLEGDITVTELFEKIAETMTGRLGMDQSALQHLLEEREQQSSTVLRPGFALPHIVIEGKHQFDIMLIRCSQGVQFPGETESVHTVFVLLGTLDERNFHLRSLANVAQIIQKPEFDKEWMAAKGEQGLRDIVLLGQRHREG